MCDDFTESDNEQYFNRPNGMSRRKFGKLSAGAALMMMLPPVLNAQDVMEMDVNIQTPDGVADCYFVHPTTGKHPAVIVWPDILGLRPAFRAMGKRLAQAGYSVLVVNPFYRSEKAPVVGEGASFSDPEVSAKVRGLAGQLNAQTHISDAKTFVEWVDQQPSVDTARKIGTTGYCMGGPMVMRTAASQAHRIGAGASFHGGGLATDRDDSPHLGFPGMNADLLLAIADNDDARDPESKNTLRAAAEAAGINAEIEVYEGANHGWTVPDSRVYHEEQAERAWARLLALFDKALA